MSTIFEQMKTRNKTKKTNVNKLHRKKTNKKRILIRRKICLYLVGYIKNICTSTLTSIRQIFNLWNFRRNFPNKMNVCHHHRQQYEQQYNFKISTALTLFNSKLTLCLFWWHICYIVSHKDRQTAATLHSNCIQKYEYVWETL